MMLKKKCTVLILLAFGACSFGCSSQGKKLPSTIMDDDLNGQTIPALDPNSIMAQLKGNWIGMVVNNSKNPLGGGEPTLGETGTPLNFTFFREQNRLVGDVTIGQVHESWVFHSDIYHWSDNKIKVITKQIDEKQLPKWIKEKAEINKSARVWSYKFESCQVLSTKTPCGIKKDLPEGADQGIWIFKIEGNKLFSHVYYTYASGGRRMLEQILTKR